MIGKPITVTAIVDIMNLIGESFRVLWHNKTSRASLILMYVWAAHAGKCVVAGNVRRTAEIAFGDPESTEYIDLKGDITYLVDCAASAGPRPPDDSTMM